MRRSALITVPLLGLMLILGACGGAGGNNPPANNPPANNPPVVDNPPPANPPPANPPPANPPPANPPPANPPPANPPPANPPPTAPTGPAKFVISELRSVPQDGINNPMWPTLLLYTVTNTGAEKGTYTAEIQFVKGTGTTGAPYDLHEAVLGNKKFSWDLNGGESATIQLNVAEEDGEFTFIVKAATGDKTIKLKWIER